VVFSRAEDRLHARAEVLRGEPRPFSAPLPAAGPCPSRPRGSAARPWPASAAPLLAPLALLLLTAVPADGAGPVSAPSGNGPQGPARPRAPEALLRKVDPVVIPGGSLHGFLGRKVESMRLYAFRDGRFLPIPFQLDRKTEGGEYIFPKDEPAQRLKAEAGLGGADELVFMARDLGERGRWEAVFPWGPDAGLTGGLEIRLADPVTGEEGWAYLFSFDRPPAPSPVDYVTYSPEDDGLTPPTYNIGFKNPRIRTSLNYASLRGADGGSVDLVDRFKARAEATFLWGKVRIRKDETDFRTRVLDVLDGPVRVIRKAEYSLRIMWNIPTPGALSYTFFYRNFIELPTRLSIPFDVGYVVSEIRSRISLDFNRAVSGAQFYNPRNPDGAVIDGRMSPSEEALDLGSFKWLLVNGPHGALLFRVLVDERLPVEMTLFYRDEALREDPPEEEPGQFGNLGWRLGNLEGIKRGRYWYRTLIYFPGDFRLGQEREYLDAEDRPLEASVQPLHFFNPEAP